MPSRTMKEVSVDVRKGSFAPAYLLHGSEEILKDEMARVIVEQALDPSTRDFNIDQVSAASLDDEGVESLCNTLPMMADRRAVVIRDLDAWKRRAKARSAFLRYLAQPSDSTVVVLLQAGDDAPDKDLARQAVTVNCTPESTRARESWVRRKAEAQGVVLEGDVLRHLVQATDTLTGASLELQKLAALPDGTLMTLELVGDLIGVRHGETALDWRNAIMDGEPGTAVALLEPVLGQSGMSGVKLVNLLSVTLAGVGVARAAYDRGSRGAALTKVAMDGMREARPFGLGSWGDESSRWARWAASWPEPRLQRAVSHTLAADTALKSTTLSGEVGVLTDLTFQLAPSEVMAAR
jgi:DNA polymerase-3 subunit delta